ncbi:MAG: C1 family peptidase, partial [Thermodesulfobacteriota bacterium]|nr:C1 family peptidase [Thermodesulfobacteriota bacterium]
MKRKILLSILGLFLVFVFAGNIWADPSECPVMPAEAWVEWLKASEAAPKAEIDENINFMLYRAESLDYGTSMDLSGHIDYDPDQRSQGVCGNCWVWAGTGVMEIAHDVDDGVFDRLSIQYLDSCKTDSFACCAGNLGAFATWYSVQGMAIPWDNTNASFADAGRRCADGTLVTCASIAKTPNYPINSISAVSIDTHSSQATAILNIKNILNQNKGVVFGFALPNSVAWTNFRDFWNCNSSETEATLWNDVDSFCGTEWDGPEAGDTAGAHAVVIYGYNDDDADSANHYWLVLNSWGTAGGDRPNGFFRVPMMMDYDCSYPDDVAPPGWWAFNFETLNVEFGNSPPIADANGPYDVECEGTTTTIDLDGSGSSDPEDTALTYVWSTDCSGGSFDDATSETPVLTVDTSPGCYVTCSVTLTVTDGDGATDTDTATVTITDTTSPDLTCPVDVTIECDESTDPSNTGSATASDGCDPAAPVITWSDDVVQGSCPAEKTITRTWTATDACGNSSICEQTINVVDTTAPVIACNAPATITPADAPISFTTMATDNCDNEPSVEITEFDCFKYTKKGKRIDKTMSCVVEVNGDTITIVDSGGVNVNIT